MTNEMPVGTQETDPVAVADILLASALTQDASVVRVTPRANGSYRVSCESGWNTLAAATLDGGVGTSAVLRLLAVAELDHVSSEPQVGRVRVRCGDALAEILVSSYTTDLGPAAELLVLGRRGDARLAGDARRGPEVLEPGARIGPYRVIERIGFGGMGAVYRVEHDELRRDFALKVLHGDLLDEHPEAAELFVREARAAARIRHRGVVDVSDCGRLDDGRPYLVMELLEGTCLGDLLRETGPAQPHRALALLREAAEALRAAHACGVVHRDISPANIFVESAGDGARVKLIDFGASTLPGREESESPEREGRVLCTPFYVAPERIRGGDADTRSDIYSLGVVFYELLTAEVPFSGDTLHDILLKHLNRPPPRPVSPYGELPSAAHLVLSRMLAKDPADRHQSLDEVIDDIDNILERS